MMPDSTVVPRQLLAVLAATMIIAGCSRSPSNGQTAGGTVDTATLATNGATPAAGPGIHVTRTDGKSVTRAMRYELTPENFSKFLAAADSVAALERRDSVSRAYLDNNLTDAGSTDVEAGRKWLESNTAVSNAINGAGISIEDYFVQGIAIAAAERFVSDPAAAPPTPTLRRNAEFLRSHTSDLARLQAEREGKPVVTVTP